MNAHARTPAVTGVDSASVHFIKAMKMAADSLFPRQDARQLLNRIQWLAAAQDGTFDTAHAALLQIEDLAADALTSLPSLP